MLEFVVGMVAARFLERFAAKIKVGIVFGTVIEVSSIVGIIWLSMITPGIRAASIPALTNAGSLWLSNSGVPIIPCVALILIFALQRGLISKLISTRFFIMLGQISFSMFLLHSVFLAYHTVRCPLRDSSQDALLFLVILFVGSYLMTAAFERPVRKLVMKVSDHLMSTEVRQTMVGDSSEARRSFFPLPAS
jgi:peptidoglycan/LPS O-acetylase OafA/YrhL